MSTSSAQSQYLSLSFLESLARNLLLMQAGEDKFIILVSGLGVGSSSSNPLQFQLLVDHITGHLGDEKVYIVSLKRYFFLHVAFSIFDHSANFG